MKNCYEEFLTKKFNWGVFLTSLLCCSPYLLLSIPKSFDDRNEILIFGIVIILTLHNSWMSADLEKKDDEILELAKHYDELKKEIDSLNIHKVK